MPGQNLGLETGSDGELRWEFRYHADGGYLEIKTRGNLTKPRMNEMVAEALLELRARNCLKCMIDYRDIRMDVNVFDIYERPAVIKQAGITTQYRICLLIEESLYEKFRFAENVYRNNGFDFGIFTEPESAIGFIAR
jgi:hypothetical protein